MVYHPYVVEKLAESNVAPQKHNNKIVSGNY